MRIENVDGVRKKLSELKKKYGKTHASVIVGYTAKYALYVHENQGQKLLGKPRPSGLGDYWDPAGAPKFLEGPAREMSKELGKTVSDAVKAGKTLEQALLLAGLKLQRESMGRVPIEYGLLRNSAFTRLESNEGDDKSENSDVHSESQSDIGSSPTIPNNRNS